MKPRVILLCCFALIGCGLHPSSLGASSDGDTIRLAGVTHPIADATLSAPVSGIIGEYHYEEGDYIEAGAVILELDKRLQELEVTRRRIVRDKLKEELDRLEYLFENTKGVSPEELGKKRSDYEVAVTEFGVAEENLKRREVVAPFDGYIANTFEFQAGEGAQAQTPLARLVDTRECLLVCNIEAAYGYQMKVGETVPLAIQAGSKKLEREGTIDFVSPVIDPASGLMKVKVVFDNPEQSVRPGEVGAILWEVGHGE